MKLNATNLKKDDLYKRVEIDDDGDTTVFFGKVVDKSDNGEMTVFSVIESYYRYGGVQVESEAFAGSKNVNAFTIGEDDLRTIRVKWIDGIRRDIEDLEKRIADLKEKRDRLRELFGEDGESE